MWKGLSRVARSGTRALAVKSGCWNIVEENISGITMLNTKYNQQLQMYHNTHTKKVR